MIQMRLIDLVKELELVNSFISKKTDARPILKQIHVVVENGEVTFYATDSYMLIKKHVKAEVFDEENQDFIIDGNFILNILKQYKKDLKESLVQFNDKFIKIYCLENIPLPQECKGVEYPKLSEIINKQGFENSTKSSFMVSPELLMSATKAISKRFDIKNIKIAIANNLMKITLDETELYNTLEVIIVIK